MSQSSYLLKLCVFVFSSLCMRDRKMWPFVFKMFSPTLLEQLSWGTLFFPLHCFLSISSRLCLIFHFIPCLLSVEYYLLVESITVLYLLFISSPCHKCYHVSGYPTYPASALYVTHTVSSLEGLLHTQAFIKALWSLVCRYRQWPGIYL